MFLFSMQLKTKKMFVGLLIFSAGYLTVDPTDVTNQRVRDIYRQNDGCTNQDGYFPLHELALETQPLIQAATEPFVHCDVTHTFVLDSEVTPDRVFYIYKGSFYYNTESSVVSSINSHCRKYYEQHYPTVPTGILNGTNVFSVRSDYDETSDYYNETSNYNETQGRRQLNVMTGDEFASFINLAIPSCATLLTISANEMCWTPTVQSHPSPTHTILTSRRIQSNLVFQASPRRYYFLAEDDGLVTEGADVNLQTNSKSLSCGNNQQFAEPLVVRRQDPTPLTAYIWRCTTRPMLRQPRPTTCPIARAPDNDCRRIFTPFNTNALLCFFGRGFVKGDCDEQDVIRRSEERDKYCQHYFAVTEEGVQICGTTGPNIISGCRVAYTLEITAARTQFSNCPTVMDSLNALFPSPLPPPPPSLPPLPVGWENFPFCNGIEGCIGVASWAPESCSPIRRFARSIDSDTGYRQCNMKPLQLSNGNTVQRCRAEDEVCIHPDWPRSR